MNRNGLLLVLGGTALAVGVLAAVFLGWERSGDDGGELVTADRALDSQATESAVAPPSPTAESGPGGSPAPESGQITETAGAAVGSTDATAAVGSGESAAEAQVASDTSSGQAAATRIRVEQKAALAEPASETPARMPPSFDVVRVEPSGETVIAGRAEPGSEVTVLDGDTAIGSVRADRSGTWVLVVERPLAPGSHHLSLRSKSADGSTLDSPNVVIVAIPAPPTTVVEADISPEAGTPEGAPSAESPTPLAVLVPREGRAPSQILQQPEGEGISDRDLVLSAVDYDSGGRVIISGSARPGDRVLIYLNNALLGQAKADAEGRWALGPGSEVVPGLHRLRVDLVDEAGGVLARIETPFSRAETLMTLAEEDFVVVQPGNSLWRIARRSYGEGPRYTVIYQSNREQIRDPDLIYPGQIFMVPEIN